MTWLEPFGAAAPLLCSKKAETLSQSSDNVDFTEAQGEATCTTTGLAMGDGNVDFTKAQGEATDTTAGLAMGDGDVDFTEAWGEATCTTPGLAMGDGDVDFTEARGVAACTAPVLAMRDGVQHFSSLLVGKDCNAPGDLIGKQGLDNPSKWFLWFCWRAGGVLVPMVCLSREKLASAGCSCWFCCLLMPPLNGAESRLRLII